MRISRRTFVHSLQGAALAGLAGRHTAAQPPTSTKINVSTLTLVTGASLTVAASASASTLCNVAISEGNRDVAAMKWVLSKDQPDSETRDAFDAFQERRGPRRYRATITLEPSVSIGLVFVQEPGDRRRGRGAGGPGAKTDPGGVARNVRFVEDPAKQPGNFLVALPCLSSVELMIWPGGDTSGVPVHTNRFNKVPEGVNPIPWNLLRDGGGRVPGGHYTAALVCTPDDQGFLPISLYSHFQVVAP